MLPEEKELRKAVMCLNLEVAEEIVNDLKAKVNAALLEAHKESTAQKSGEAVVSLHGAKCKGCGKSIDIDYCTHCNELLAI